MNTNELIAILNHVLKSKTARGWNAKNTNKGLSFEGVYAKDELPSVSNIARFPTCLIANTDEANQPGEHWVAFILRNSSSYEFFDSFALNPIAYQFPHNVTNSTCKELLNFPVQSEESDVCGQHCVYFLSHRILDDRLSFDSVIKSYKKNDLKWNDNMVSRFACKHFNFCKTQSFDNQPCNQSCKIKCECNVHMNH